MLFLSPFFFWVRGAGGVSRSLDCSGEIAPQGGGEKSGGAKLA